MGMVSHELKTPLTSLQAYIQILQRIAAKEENPQQQNILEKCFKQTNYMNSMINGFLNVSRLDSGRLHMEKVIFDFHVLFSEIEDEVLSTNPARHFVFKSSGQTMILADREKIAQVLHNLIGNAIKYSPSDTSITVEYLTMDQNNLIIHIQDKGIGISEEDQERIFDRYYRVKDLNSRFIAGFGIGLYLSKEIIELHNGTIQVKSTKNEGTIFSIILPIDGVKTIN
ncbi:ATP-binding protein [Chryseobacterium formosus]|uniref:histidine kinase n=1 Tax=Chryseobacterium formosus TaxID=1537363 RepID=A0ABT3XQJ0_9FLAO|nr:ATP-binding protein [Chryseobacterium formosus]MCX8523906.1 ATP-binding protein [Chryseobacterium formosus]